VTRPRLQQKIQEQLHGVPENAEQATRILVIYGLGGSGKSQLALNFVRTCRRDYAAMFWIEAGQKETIERDYLLMHRLLFGGWSAGLKSPTIEEAVMMVKSWFHGKSGRSLVIFDSADTIDEADDASCVDLEYFLPDAPSVDVIITTRSSRAWEMTALEAVEVADMEPAEAAALFRTSANLGQIGSEVEREVLLIVEELEYLALAVTLAGSYVAATPRLSSDLGQYLPEYRDRRKQLLNVKAQKHIHRYGESVLSTWETSFSAIARQSPMAARMLNLLAFLNFDDIFLDLFLTNTSSTAQFHNGVTGSGRGWWSFVACGDIVDRYTVESAFAILRIYSLVQWRHDQTAYRMHKLVHAWGRDRLDLERQCDLSLMALELLTDIIPSAAGNSIFGMRLVPHLMANFAVISETSTAVANIDNESLESVAVVGEFLRGLGRWWDESEIQAFHFKKTFEAAGAEHPNTLTSMNNLAVVLSHQGKYEQAEEMHQQALRLSETVLGKEHPSTLTSMNNLALVLSHQGKYKQSEEMHQQALKLSEIVLGKEHPSTLTSMNNLASVLSHQGKYEQSEEIYQQALKLREIVLGKEHPSTLTSMNNLALVLSDQGKYKQSEEMHQQALKLREIVLGKEHPSTLTSMNNLALVLSDQGKYEQSEEMHQQALKLSETVLGKEHPSTLTSMNNLALVLSDQGKYEQAEEMHQQALKLSEIVLRKEHPSTLTSMNNLALVLSDQGKYKQAEEMHQQALKLREIMLGKEHPSTLTSMNNLALVLSHQGKYKQSEEMHQQALKLSETVLGKEHPSTLTSMNNLALVLSHQGKYEQSEEMYQQTLKLREIMLGKEHPSTLISMNNLASVLSHQGKYEQAEEMHQQALKLKETVLGKEHPSTLTSMNNLASVLRDQGKYEQAEEMHQEALELSETMLGKDILDTGS
jgi:tetratricopeptide (TPR) repeat protein